MSGLPPSGGAVGMDGGAEGIDTAQLLGMLHYGASAGRTDVVREAVKLGAQPSGWVTVEVEPGGTTIMETALHAAAKNNHVDCVRSLLALGADPYVWDSNGASPVTCTDNEEILLAFVTELCQRAARDDVNGIVQLVSAGVEPNHEDSLDTMNTALHWACVYGNLEAAECLLKLGANVNARNAKAFTPLVEARRAGSQKLVALLLERGAAADDADEDAPRVAAADSPSTAPSAARNAAHSTPAAEQRPASEADKGKAANAEPRTSVPTASSSQTVPSMHTRQPTPPTAEQTPADTARSGSTASVTLDGDRSTSSAQERTERPASQQRPSPQQGRAPTPPAPPAAPAAPLTLSERAQPPTARARGAPATATAQPPPEQSAPPIVAALPPPAASRAEVGDASTDSAAAEKGAQSMRLSTPLGDELPRGRMAAGAPGEGNAGANVRHPHQQQQQNNRPPPIDVSAGGDPPLQNRHSSEVHQREQNMPYFGVPHGIQDVSPHHHNGLPHFFPHGAMQGGGVPTLNVHHFPPGGVPRMPPPPGAARYDGGDGGVGVDGGDGGGVDDGHNHAQHPPRGGAPPHFPYGPPAELGRHAPGYPPAFPPPGMIGPGRGGGPMMQPPIPHSGPMPPHKDAHAAAPPSGFGYRGWFSNLLSGGGTGSQQRRGGPPPPPPPPPQQNPYFPPPHMQTGGPPGQFYPQIRMGGPLQLPHFANAQQMDVPPPPYALPLPAPSMMRSPPAVAPPSPQRGRERPASSPSPKHSNNFTSAAQIDYRPPSQPHAPPQANTPSERAATPQAPPGRPNMALPFHNGGRPNDGSSEMYSGEAGGGPPGGGGGGGGGVRMMMMGGPPHEMAGGMGAPYAPLRGSSHGGSRQPMSPHMHHSPQGQRMPPPGHQHSPMKAAIRDSPPPAFFAAEQRIAPPAQPAGGGGGDLRGRAIFGPGGGGGGSSPWMANLNEAPPRDQPVTALLPATSNAGGMYVLPQWVLLLWPRPQRFFMTATARQFFIPPEIIISADVSFFSIARQLAGWLQSCDLGPKTRITTPHAGRGHVHLSVNPDQFGPRSQSYQLTVRPTDVTIVGSDAAGLFYGCCTLDQIVNLVCSGGRHTSLPCCSILDWPTLGRRGVMLDVSRGKVPTMASLCALLERLARLKFNQLQLYIEHAFAYAGHEEVWRDSGALGAEELMALDALARELFVELVPCQSSLSGFNVWLKSPRYKHLAECPDDADLAGYDTSEPRSRMSLCATDGRSVKLVADLYEQLLPCFSGTQLHAGLDGAWDICRGRSVKELARRGGGGGGGGVERVVLEYLGELAHAAAARGKRTVQFWADVLDPLLDDGAFDATELAALVPRGAVVMERGSEAEHPFDQRCRRLAELGLSFFVCPSSSAHNSFGGRVSNCLENVRAAAMAALNSGAAGLLLTDMGYNGHLQPLVVSYPGFVAAAGAAWYPEEALNASTDGVRLLAALMDAHIFMDPDSSSAISTILCTVGDLHLVAEGRDSTDGAYNGGGGGGGGGHVGTIGGGDGRAHSEHDTAKAPPPAGGGTRLFQLLVNRDDGDTFSLDGLSVSGLQRVQRRIERSIDLLDSYQGRAGRADVEEVRLVVEFLRVSARFGTALLVHKRPDANELSIKQLPDGVRMDIATLLMNCIDMHKYVWAKRNGPEGFTRSWLALNSTLKRLAAGLPNLEHAVMARRESWKL